MINGKKLLEEIVDVIHPFAEDLDIKVYSAVMQDIFSQVTSAMIREHELALLESTHPAIKDLRDKLNMTITLLKDQQ